jgi:hypothetical protein
MFSHAHKTEAKCGSLSVVVLATIETSDVTCHLIVRELRGKSMHK